MALGHNDEGEMILYVCHILFFRFCLVWWRVTFKIMLTFFYFVLFLQYIRKDRKKNCINDMSVEKLLTTS